MSDLTNVCTIESGGFAFGYASEHLRTANRAIVIKDFPFIKIKMDNRGSSAVRKRNNYGGFVVGISDDSRSTGKIGSRYRFRLERGWIVIDLEDEVK